MVTQFMVGGESGWCRNIVYCEVLGRRTDVFGVSQTLFLILCIMRNGLADALLGQKRGFATFALSLRGAESSCCAYGVPAVRSD